MGVIDKNQYDYLQNLVSQGGGNGEWAKAQLQGATVAPPTPTPPPTPPPPPPKPVSPPSGYQGGSAPILTPNTINNSTGGSSGWGGGSGGSSSSSGSSGGGSTIPAGGMGGVPMNNYGGFGDKGKEAFTDNGQAGLDSLKQTQGNAYLGKDGAWHGNLTPAQLAAMQSGQGFVPNIMTGGGYFAPPPPFKPVIPAPPAIPVRDKNAIASYVDQQLAKALADATKNKDQALTTAQNDASQSSNTLNTQLQQAINRINQGKDTALSGIQTGYDRMRGQITDDRTLENTQLGRNLDPFSGRSDYAMGMVARERATTDRQQQEDLQSRVGTVNSEASTAQTNASLDTQNRLGAITQNLDTLKANINQNYQALKDATPAQREALIMQIEKDEREYDLALKGNDRADVMAQAQLQNQAYQQALGKFQADRGVLESDRGYNLDAKKFDYLKEFNGQNQHLDLAKWLTETYGVNAQPKNDAGVAFDQVAGKVPLNQQDAIFKQEQAKIKDEQWKKEFELDYAKFGLDTAMKNQAVKNQQQNNDYQNSMLKLNQAKFDADQKQLANENKAVSKSDLDQLNTRFIHNDQYDGPTVTDPSGLRQAIVMLKDKAGNYLSQADVARILAMYGLPAGNVGQ